MHYHGSTTFLEFLQAQHVKVNTTSARKAAWLGSKGINSATGTNTGAGTGRGAVKEGAELEALERTTAAEGKVTPSGKAVPPVLAVVSRASTYLRFKRCGVSDGHKRREKYI